MRITIAANWKGPKRLSPIVRVDGKKPKPRDVAAALAAMLRDVARHRRPRWRYNEACVRLTMQQVNKIRDRPPNAEMSEHYRHKLIKAGRDELIVIGVGDNVVLITHDDDQRSCR